MSVFIHLVIYLSHINKQTVCFPFTIRGFDNVAS
jgi:hypothetical protein